ncbi:MAG: ABC-F family ATP-binding cassette domain-containing protein [Myxococcaceae bacterium]|nr:ABC-F family ATP-binding cassette domain-containing protein [Myxococcaceae bacterium]MBH2005805.1 ABC-F family ATP-binding cassette domain-containing protein [Myxococcaceae bacterium]
MVSVSGLAKQYGPRVLFENVSFQLNPGQRIGLVGSNGSGKSTLLRILTDEEEPSLGRISWPKSSRLGFLRQDQFLNDALGILQSVMLGDRLAYEALQGQSDSIPPDAYTLESRSAAILEGLGIASSVHQQPVSSLSGGFKLRVLLAQCLVSAPDVLLLDEPTNHLDIVTIRWLEKFLLQFSGALLVISHDRGFLDRISTHILDIDYQTATLFTGNYEAFENAKRLIQEQKKAQIARIEAEIAHKQAFVDRFKAKATKARQAQSRVKQIEKMDIPEWVESSRRYPSFAFPLRRSSGREVLKIESLGKSFGDKVVLTGVSGSIRRGERIGIIGPNGVGKSTLLKILTSELAAEGGHFVWGHEAQIGYFAQDHEAFLKKLDQTAESWLWQFCPEQSLGFVRSYLGRVLFSGDDALKKLSALSGGELARLDLARLMIQQPNVLILDEPTNHLDLEAIEALVQALSLYEGTLVFVSHDRWFVSRLAKTVWEITHQGLSPFLGSFEDYLQKNGEDYLQPVSLSGNRSSKVAKPRRDNREQRKNEKRVQEILSEIENLELEQKEIERCFSEDGFYLNTSLEDQRKLQERQNQNHQKLEERMILWETLLS